MKRTPSGSLAGRGAATSLKGLALALVMLTLGACGQKGPLYMQAAQAPTSTPTTAPAAQASAPAPAR